MTRFKRPRFLFELFCLFGDDAGTHAEIAREFLVRVGLKREDIIIVEKAGFFRLSMYFGDRLTAQRARMKINKFLKGKLRFRIKKLKNENWKVKTAKNFSIFALTKKFDIVPSWKKKKYHKTSRIPIIIDSINAFGTGLHETTSFMARLIERMEGKFESFLDVGTGTGLLAMIALKCGAQDVRAIDFDPDAVTAARQNLTVNHYPKDIVRQGDIAQYCPRKRFDFVAANLITRDLIKYKKQILATVKKSGFLAISGIMIENRPLIKKAFGLKKLRCVKICQGEQWMAFLYQRTRQ